MGLLTIGDLSGLGQDDGFVWDPVSYALQVHRGEKPSVTKWYRAMKEYGSGPASFQFWRQPSVQEAASAGARERVLKEAYGRHTVSPLLMREALERKERSLREAYRRGVLMPRTVAEREDVERFRSSFVPAHARQPTRADYERYKRVHAAARRKRQIQARAAREAQRVARIAMNQALSRRNEELLRRQAEQQRIAAQKDQQRRARELAAAKATVRKVSQPITYRTPTARGGLLTAVPAAGAAVAAALAPYTSPF